MLLGKRKERPEEKSGILVNPTVNKRQQISQSKPAEKKEQASAEKKSLFIFKKSLPMGDYSSDDDDSSSGK